MTKLWHKKLGMPVDFVEGSFERDEDSGDWFVYIVYESCQCSTVARYADLEAFMGQERPEPPSSSQDTKKDDDNGSAVVESAEKEEDVPRRKRPRRSCIVPRVYEEVTEEDLEEDEDKEILLAKRGRSYKVPRIYEEEPEDDSDDEDDIRDNSSKEFKTPRIYEEEESDEDQVDASKKVNPTAKKSSHKPASQSTRRGAAQANLKRETPRSPASVDSEVQVLSPRAVKRLKDSQLENVREKAEEKEDDDEVQTVAVRNDSVMIHPRNGCPRFAFVPGKNRTVPDENNQQYCGKCYCWICEKPAAECNDWRTHANADGKDPYWIRQKPILQRRVGS
jgi:hypothetical protein